jgi:hypothetical protein
MEKIMKADVEDDPYTGIHQIKSAKHVAGTVVIEQLPYPYYLQWVQALSLLDFCPCQQFWQWFFGTVVRIPSSSHILFFWRNRLHMEWHTEYP